MDPNETKSVCTGCDKHVDPLDMFPEDRCIECHAGDPAVQRELATMTSEKLARIWGAQS